MTSADESALIIGGYFVAVTILLIVCARKQPKWRLLARTLCNSHAGWRRLSLLFALVAFWTAGIGQGNWWSGGIFFSCRGWAFRTNFAATLGALAPLVVIHLALWIAAGFKKPESDTDSTE